MRPEIRRVDSGAMTRLRAVLLVALVLALVPFVASGQAENQTTTQTGAVAAPASASGAGAVAADPVLPKDPGAVMQLAARVNGLDSADMKPWHLKANYQTFDADGKPKDKGVFEEWWAGPEKYKISYTSAGFNQVQYHNGKDTLMTGNVKWPQQPEADVERYLFHPLPSESVIEAQKYIAKDVKDGPVSLICLRPNVPAGYTANLAYCFGIDNPAIRIEEFSFLTTFFNGVVKVDGHYVARQVRALKASKPLLNVDVTVLEFPTSFEDKEFVAPASAVAAPVRRIAVAAEVLAGSKISGINVKYPAGAWSARVQGAVVLGATITKEGTIDNLKVVSGPVALQQASIDAVKTWRYKPYLLNGQPVEVETEITVTFKLGGP